MKRVVITGMGTVNPLGNNVADFWKGIVDNKIGFSFVDKFDSSRTGVSIAGTVKNFNEEDYYNDPACFDKKESRRMDRFTKFALVSTSEALKDCGTDFKDINPYRAGVIIGCGIGGLELTEQEHQKYLEKGPRSEEHTSELQSRI